ncbi:hypothetical protein NP493_1557g00022 [Ridgeia piscesae]|uniref:Mitotic checkpoint serine/threonine-protein kinase BUB1 n=1 Tax=Ridgeia piscesae TaxID=27915 RepID=A0AAD9N9H6_RIDPI|nr:hypothetical protein NP493_1557g00022 [Ridgeia piscesae]
MCLSASDRCRFDQRSNLSLVSAGRIYSHSFNWIVFTNTPNADMNMWGMCENWRITQCYGAPQQLVSLEQEKQTRLFETELRSYNGNDPLDVWHSDNRLRNLYPQRYIQWTEQNFPKGGKESNIQQLVEKCITAFKDDERYKNDTRLIDIWFKFTSYCANPLEIYSYLFNQGIGCGLARFYDTWASELEKLGNTKKADLIYLRGIETGAQPVDLLKRQHSEFQARVARGVAGHMTEDVAMTTTDHGESEPHRMALGQLKAKGKKATAPVNRTGIPITHGAAARGLSHHVPDSNAQQTFAVFADENVAPTSIPAQTKDWATVPGREAERENDQGPGRWTGARVKERHRPVVPVSGLSSHAKLPDFCVHQDDTPETPSQLPQKGPQVDQVLSARKAGKDVDPFHSLQHQQAQATGGALPVSMYDKHKVYAGVSEFSFEQIRAADWFRCQRRQEERRLEDERRREQELRNERLEQQVAEQQRMIQKLKQNQEMLATMMVSAKNQEPDVSIDRDVKQVVNTSSQNSSIRCGNSFTGHMTSGTSFSAESSLRQESSFRGSAQADAPRVPSGGRFQAPIALALKESMSAESSVLSSSAHASNESSLNSSSGRRGRNMSRSGWLSAPSPTVNTVEAMRVVQNMFSTKLRSDDTEQFEAMYALEKDDSVMPPPVTRAAAFTIFEESRDTEQDKKFGQEIAMESDKENLVPTVHEMAPPKHAGLKVKSVEGVPLDAQQLCVDLASIGETRPRYVTHDAVPMEMGSREPSTGQPLVHQDDEEMDGIEMTYSKFDVTGGDDMTFAPTSSSTQNFTAAARLASTPFNILADMAPLPEPPLSTIKPPTVTTGATRVLHQSENAGPADVTSDSESGEKRRSERFSIYVQQENLSTIMEGSNEGKSHSSASSGGSTTCGGATTVEWSRHCSQSTTHNLTVNQSKKVSDESHALAVKFDRTIDLDCTTHNIDTTNYVPPFGDVSMAADPFEMSIAIDPNDPFDEDLVADFLSSLAVPIETRPNYLKTARRFPCITVGLINVLGDKTYQVDCLLGEGAYAKVYQATMLDMGTADEGVHKVLKVQKPACRWEFYIVTELQQRLSDLNSHIDVTPSVMSIDRAYFYRDGSCLVSDLHKYGTLLELVNAGKKLGKSKPQSEMVSICLVIEMLHIVEQMHRCNIIHGDIKPDNFLLRGLKPLADASGPAEMLAGHTRALQLIDFGRSIDMTMFRPGTTFTVKVETDGFQCIEMKTDRPWTYQTDMFGIIGTVHVLLFGKYMQVYQEAGRWRTTNTFKR